MLKLLRIKEINHNGNSILREFGLICNLDNQILPHGINIMDCGQVKPLLYLLLTLDGFICLPTLFHFTVLFQDSRVNSQVKSPHGLMIGKVLIITGSMKDQIMIPHGCCLKECGDGLDGKMELMSSLPTNQRPDGITSQTVDLILNKTLDMESITLNMFIITTFTPMCMKSQEPPGASKELITINSLEKENSLMSLDGDHKNIYFI